jgi:DNA polymerase
MNENELEQIKAELKECSACDLCKGRKNAVACNGDCNAKIMVIGESPGEKEDELGKPYIRRIG